MSFINHILILISILVFLFSLICFIFEFKHLLSSLVCLELLALVIFITLSLITYSLFTETIYSLIYISVAVCEAALGLRIAVLYVYRKGNEILKNF